MKTTITVGQNQLEFNRNWFTGEFYCDINGRRKTLASPFNPFTHFQIGLTRTYTFEVDHSEIQIIKTRPTLFGAMKTNRYQIFVDKQLIKEIE